MRGWRRTLAIGGLGAVLAGCRADEPGPRAVDPDADPVADPDPDAAPDPDADPDPDPDRWFVPAVVTLSASFGYDRDRGILVDGITPYGTTESRLRLEVGDARWADTGFDPYQTERYCVVELPLGGGGPAPWAAGDPAVWFGADYQGAPPDSDCDAAHGYDVLPSAFAGHPDLATALAARGWGVGVGEPSVVDPVMADFVSTYPYAVVPEGALLGGYASDGLLGQVTGRVMAVGHPIDADGFVDHTAWLDATAAHPGGDGLASGWYQLFFLYSVSL